MLDMTLAEYAKLHPDYRHEVNGKPYVLRYEQGATVLEPVRFVPSTHTLTRCVCPDTWDCPRCVYACEHCSDEREGA